MSYYSVGETPIGSGPRKDTSELFSFDFRKKSRKASSSRLTVASAGPRSRTASFNFRPTITATPKVKSEERNRSVRRKLTSTSSASNSSRTTSPRAHLRENYPTPAHHNKKPNARGKPAKQRQKGEQYSVKKGKRKLTVNNNFEDDRNENDDGDGLGRSTSESTYDDESRAVDLATPPKKSRSSNSPKKPKTRAEKLLTNRTRGGELKLNLEGSRRPSSSEIPKLPPVYIHVERLREYQIQAFRVKPEIQEAEVTPQTTCYQNNDEEVSPPSTTDNQKDDVEVEVIPLSTTDQVNDVETVTLEAERPDSDDNNLTEQATINLSSNIIDNENVDSQEDAEVIEFQVEEAVDNYNTLRNSEITNNRIVVEEKLTKGFASFVTPDIGALREDVPGVAWSVINASASLNVGYLTIEPKTVKPFDCMENVQLLYWILSGTVMIRSTGGYYTKGEEPEKTNYLYGKSLSTGSCIMIPPNTCFTVENWGDTSSLIGYCTVFGET